MRSLFIFALLSLTRAERKDYTRHRLVSVHATTREHLELLSQLQTDRGFEELDFWTELTLARPVDIRVSPNDFGTLQALLRLNNIEFDVLNEDLQDVIDKERTTLEKARAARVGSCDITSTYCTYAEINEFLEGMETQYPNQIQLTDIGSTYEGRKIYNVKVAESLSLPKTSVWVEAGTHAREWIAIASALNLIQKLVDGSASSNDMLAAYDWNIVPLHNPDGYVYTHTSERYHRKNRQPPASGFCSRNRGTDLNRNWDAYHGSAGTSSTCSDDTFGGGSAFDAMETQALANAVNNEINNVFAFFSVHCYSEYLLIPFGYTSQKPSRYQHLADVAEDMLAWLETVRGRYYQAGTPPDLLYSASGSAYDYFYLQGVPYSYTYELSPSGNQGLPGFNLDPSYISDVSEELYRSLWGFVNLNLSWP